MKRIVICGLSGSGKTTFARELSRLTDIEVLHIDGTEYKSKTSMRTDSERHEYIRSKLLEPSWIADGVRSHYLTDLDGEFDHFYFFELPWHHRFPNLLKRVWRDGGVVTDDMTNAARKIYDFGYFYEMIVTAPKTYQTERELFLAAPSTVRCVYVKSANMREQILTQIREQFESNA